MANGFASCGDPAALQAVCDRLGPSGIQASFDYWTDRIPTPFTVDDRTADYCWDLSMRQVEHQGGPTKAYANNGCDAATVGSKPG